MCAFFSLTSTGVDFIIVVFYISTLNGLLRLYLDSQWFTSFDSLQNFIAIRKGFFSVIFKDCLKFGDASPFYWERVSLAPERIEIELMNDFIIQRTL